MPYTRSHRSREITPDEPEPTTAQLLTFLIRQSEERRIEREEKRAEKLARRAAEEEARRVEQEARRAEEEARRAEAHHRESVGSFFKFNPPHFHGTEDALAADDWVKEITGYLDAAAVADAQRVTVVKLLLRENARIWWEAESQHYVALDLVPTWDQFCRGFLKKFFPETQEAQMEAQFANLEQGTMTVDQYVAEFTRLSRFCPEIAASPIAMMKKFRRGLRAEIKDSFAFARLATFDEVLEAARAMELTKPRVSSQPALQGRMFQPLQCTQQQQRQQFVLRPQQIQGGSAQGPARGPGRDGPICGFCHKSGHVRRNCWWAKRLCLRCGSPDHAIAACPQPKLPAPAQPRQPLPAQQDAYRQQDGKLQRRAQVLQMISDLLQDDDEQETVPEDLTSGGLQVDQPFQADH